METTTMTIEKTFTTKEELVLFFNEFLEKDEQDFFENHARHMETLENDDTPFEHVYYFLRKWAFENTDTHDGNGYSDNGNTLLIGNRTFTLNTSRFTISVFEEEVPTELNSRYNTHGAYNAISVRLVETL